ncbi:photosynthetic NDH subunit of subcomplex B 3, chloroplastic [Andrographis paniculata]|uniref:photosynthetic NDH subunit of subcomplex B 3, chloroplastic n=1 Tax=Andrographis paniculata TaxID=175694 RepID=UPI0021E895CE|nr:photosynthetic NDH subunit of subcomplex B 3, chloroplastic [Andrographis paniculata]
MGMGTMLLHQPINYCCCCYYYSSSSSFSKLHKFNSSLSLSSNSKKAWRIRAAAGDEAADKQSADGAVNFAFVSSVLFPDGTPDVQYRRACGGQKLRDFMLDNNLELYGPYSRPLLNCAGGATCGTCIVEVVEGKELLSPKNDKEKEKLRKKPRNWRLACQATVAKPPHHSTEGSLVVIQQLPEWKAHDWVYGREPPQDEETVYV